MPEMIEAIAWVCLAAAPSPAANARAALEQACGRCHRGGPDANEGGFDFLLDRDALIREELVAVGRPGSSRLLQRVRRAEMPPDDAPERKWRGPVIAALDAWIRAGAPAERFSSPKAVAAAVEPAPILSRDVLLREVREDLERLTEPQRRNARYFVGDEGPALAKVLSSLTWTPSLIIPVRVSPHMSRVDLRELGWSANDWNRVLAAYPFAFSSGSFDEDIVVAATQTPQPFVRAAWFIATATRPPLYHALLKLPVNEAGLEELLGVSVRDDIARGAVVRAGFNNSGISQNNRLIERHAGRFGPYWRSYDFASNVGAKNLFERPLRFVHDGGEHIFALPNGMFGFMLADARGGRIDRGPTAIVRDERRPDGAVENGLSCMGCHARGFIPKTDQVLASVLASPSGFSASERRQVEQLHPLPTTLDGIFPLDSAGLLEALGKLGVAGDEEEPITAVAQRYERALDLKACASELGVAPHVLFRALERGPEALAPLRVGGNVKRDAFTAAFPTLVRRLRLGHAEAVQSAKPGAAGVTECGVSSAYLEARLEDCRVAFPERATHGPYRLVAHFANGKEVWLDGKRRLLWSPAEQAASQSHAAELCSGEQSLDALWFLPSAGDLEEALEDGLPDAGWQPLWSRDSDQAKKLARAPGFAVSAAGRTEEEPQALLPSRCIARL